MYAEERQTAILEYLEKSGRADVAMLADFLHTSRETIRRDLKELEGKGLLIKTHGGAISTDKSSVRVDTHISTRENVNTEAKDRLASYAASFIKDGDYIFLDNSSTVSYMVGYLPRSYKLTLITNSVMTLVSIVKHSSLNWQIISIGGVLADYTLSASGYMAAQNIRNYKPSKAFLSCHGIDSALDAVDGIHFDSEIKQEVISNSLETFLLADNSKLGRYGISRVAPVTAYDHVILEPDADVEFIQRMKEAGAKLLFAP